VCSALNDVWEWDGSSWSEIPVDNVRPPERQLAVAGFDRSRGVFVLFGGALRNESGGIKVLDDTWEWNGASWRQVEGSGPPGRFGATMIYNPTESAVQLLLGITETSDFSDSWELGN